MQVELAAANCRCAIVSPFSQQKILEGLLICCRGQSLCDCLGIIGTWVWGSLFDGGRSGHFLTLSFGVLPILRV